MNEKTFSEWIEEKLKDSDARSDFNAKYWSVKYEKKDHTQWKWINFVSKKKNMCKWTQFVRSIIARQRRSYLKMNEYSSINLFSPLKFTNIRQIHKAISKHVRYPDGYFPPVVYLHFTDLEPKSEFTCFPRVKIKKNKNLISDNGFEVAFKSG